MSKIAILGDTHFGARNSNTDHMVYMEKFFRDFFAYIDANDVKYILQLGDLFDVRKHINILTLNFFRKVFFNEVLKRDIHVWVLVGNHDIYHRETLSVNSIEETLKDSKTHFTIVSSPGDYVIDETSFFIVPWICKENHSDVYKELKKSKAKYCGGHFEFNGFEMHRGQPAKTHFNHSDFSKFDTVFSGHFHHKSVKDNIIYTGTPYQLTWQDHNDEKGFWILEDHKISFIPNKHTIYSMIEYFDGLEVSESDIQGKYVKVMVTTPPDKKFLNSFVESLNLMKPLDVKVSEKYNISFSNKITTNIKDTSSIISEFVQGTTTDLDKEKLVSIMNTLHNEALAKE